MALLSVPVIVGTGAYAVMRMVAPTLFKKLTQQGVKNIRKVPKTKLSSVPKSTPRLTTNDAKKLVDGKPITRSPKKLSNKKTTPTETKRPEIKMSSGPSNRKMTTGDKAIMGTIGTLGAGAAIGAIGEKLSKENKKNKLSNQEKRLSKFASENIAATNRKQSSNGIAGPSKALTKRPASIKAGSGKGLGTLSQIASKYGTTVKELMKANKDITNADVIQKGQEIKLGKVVKDRKSVYQKKSGGPVVKKMGGGKVYRRGGGQALRGFGKATYSNKMY